MIRMPTFGGYETVAELHRSALTILWSARAVGGAAPGEFVVKSCRPAAHFAADAEAKAIIDEFLDSAEAQKKLVAGGAEHWAKIHECGEDQGGCYYVSDYYGQNLEKIVRGRVKLPAESLHHIISAVVSGLDELKRFLGRPHGNVTLANVLLLSGRNPAETPVVLTDPLPAGKLDEATGASRDLRALGELLYQMVMYRSAASISGMEVRESEEWTRLGAAGQEWRSLTNRLLRAGAAGEELTLEEVAKQLDSLRPSKRRMTMKIGLIGIAVLLVGVCAGVLFTGVGRRLIGGFGGNIFSPPRSSTGVGEYVEMAVWYYNWFKPLETVNADIWPAWGRDDEDLRQVGENIAAARQQGVELDRRLQADQDGLQFRSLTEIGLLEGIKTAFEENKSIEAVVGSRHEMTVEKLYDVLNRSKENTEKTLRTHAVMKGLYQTLTGPFLAPIDQVLSEYKQRNWLKSANYMQSLVSDFRNGMTGSQTGSALGPVERIDDVLQAKSHIRQVQREYEILAGQQQKIEAAGDKTLARFGQCVMAYLATPDEPGGASDLKTLQGKLDRVRTVATSLLPYVDYWKDEVDHESFAAYSPGEPINLMTFVEDWPSQLRSPNYRKIAAGDPRDAAWNRLMAKQKAEITQKMAKLTDLGDSANHEKATRRWEPIVQDESGLLALSWGRQNQTEIEAGVVRLKDKLGSLNGELDGWIAWNYPDEMDHPLRKWDWELELTAVGKVIAQIGEGKMAGEFSRELEALSAELRRWEPDSTPWVRSKQSAVVAAVSESRGRLQSLRGRLEAELVKLDPRMTLKALYAEAEGSYKSLQGAETASASIEPFKQRLETLAGEVNALEKLLWSDEQQRDRIRAAVEQNQPKLVALNTEMTARMNELLGPPAEPDPRIGWSWQSDVEKIREAVAMLADVYRDKTGAAAVTRQLNSVVADVTELADTQKLPWNRANQDQLTWRKTEAETALAKLRDDVNVRLAQEQAKTASQLRETRTFNSPSVGSVWGAKVETLIANIQSPVAMKVSEEKLAGLLGQLDSLVDTVAAGPRGSEDQAAKIFYPRRESAITAAAKAISITPDNDFTPMVDQDQWDAPQQQFKQWAGEVNELMADFKAIEGRLEQGYGLEDETIKALDGKWVGKESRLQFGAALASVETVLEDLQEIASGTISREQLSEKIEETSLPVVALASWRAVSGGGDWPATPADLKQEYGFQTRLKSLIEIRVTDAPRRAAIGEELADEGHRRWRTCFARLDTHTDLEAVVEVAGEFGVSLTVGDADGDFNKLSPAGRYNYLLYQLRTRDFKDVKDEQVIEALGQFAQSVRQYCTGVTEQTAVAQTLEAMGVMRPTEGAGDVSNQLGELWQGRQYTTPDGLKAVQYTRRFNPNAPSLEFVEVRPPGAAKPAMLCTTEVSMGLFAGVIDAEGKRQWQQILSAGLLPEVGRSRNALTPWLL
ncbi:MAG: hypothetical protein HQ546_06785, partial [Planctomycetes bacterium]|nr:hypothetical protein [Planctomycetota bacterium]